MESNYGSEKIKRQIQRYEERRREMAGIYSSKSYKHLEHMALGIISASIGLLILLAIFYNVLSPVAANIMRGFTGLGVVAFMCVSTVLIYRANGEYYRRKRGMISSEQSAESVEGKAGHPA